MKTAIVAVFALLCLVGCSKSFESPATQTEALRPGQTVHIYNSNVQVHAFDIQASYPVTIKEADCTWNAVTSAHFTCSHVSDIEITDERSKLLFLAQPNSIQITYMVPRTTSLIPVPMLGYFQVPIVVCLFIAIIGFVFWYFVFRDPYKHLN